MSLHKGIVREIIKAQIASDGGKGIYDIKHIINNGEEYAKRGYGAKNRCIRKAIFTINHDKNTGFSYHVVKAKNFYRECYIIYFNFKIKGKRHQIAFHSFDDWSFYVKPHTPIKWLEDETNQEAAVALGNLL